MKFTAYSYSRLALYEKCPRQAAGKFLWKTLPGPDYVDDPEFFLKGRRVHGGMAAYLTGAPFYSAQDKKTYTEDARFEATKIARFAKMIDEIRDNVPFVEQQWGYDRQYEPSSWFGPQVYWRSVLDAGVLWPDNAFSAVDWKTGKPSRDSLEQTEQQAMSVFKRFPRVNFIDSRLVYLDYGTEVKEEYTRDQLTGMVDKWEGRVAPMMNDQAFAPRPGPHCSYCPFRKAVGGPCQHGG